MGIEEQALTQLTKTHNFKQNCKSKASILWCQNGQTFPFSPKATIYKVASLPHSQNYSQYRKNNYNHFSLVTAAQIEAPT